MRKSKISLPEILRMGISSLPEIMARGNKLDIKQNAAIEMTVLRNTDVELARNTAGDSRTCQKYSWSEIQSSYFPEIQPWESRTCQNTAGQSRTYQKIQPGESRIY